MPVSLVIAGLGNPGSKYEGTRHNAGFAVIDLFAEEAKISLSERDGAMQGKLSTGGTDAALVLKPMQYMNLSGESIAKVMNFHKLSPERLVVVYDDCELPVGKIRLQQGGGHSGHNGIKSIESCLSGAKNFWRIRVGISRPSAREGGAGEAGSMELSDWVLSRFSGSEQALMRDATRNAANALQAIVADGFVKAQNRCNR